MPAAASDRFLRSHTAHRVRPSVLQSEVQGIPTNSVPFPKNRNRIARIRTPPSSTSPPTSVLTPDSALWDASLATTSAAAQFPLSSRIPGRLAGKSRYELLATSPPLPHAFPQNRVRRCAAGTA